MKSNHQYTEGSDSSCRAHISVQAAALSCLHSSCRAHVKAQARAVACPGTSVLTQQLSITHYTDSTSTKVLYAAQAVGAGFKSTPQAEHQVSVGKTFQACHCSSANTSSRQQPYYVVRETSPLSIQQTTQPDSQNCR